MEQTKTDFTPHANWRDAMEIALVSCMKSGSEFTDSNHIANTVRLQISDKDRLAMIKFIVAQQHCSQSEAEHILQGMSRAAAATRLETRTKRVKTYSVLSPLIVVGLLLCLYLVRNIFLLAMAAVFALALILLLKNAARMKAKEIWRDSTDSAAALEQMCVALERSAWANLSKPLLILLLCAIAGCIAAYVFPITPQ